jgi:hypothetical protein
MERPPLSRSSRLILGFHVLLAIIFAVVGLVDTAAGDGWADLARFVTLLLAGAYLLAVATITAIARYATANATVRVLLLLFGPPVLIVIAIFAIRGG